MRTTSMLLGSLAAAALMIGCGSHQGTRNNDLDELSASLVNDNDQTEETEQDLEASIEQPLSGSPSEEAAVDVTSEATAAAAAVSNAGLYFRPAGCIQSTRAGNVITHTFDDCTGPHGRAHMSGVITSTWTKSSSGVQVEHTAKSFHVNGAELDHTATLAYSYEGGVYTMQRVATTSGRTGRGVPIQHEAAYSTTWQPQSRCVTRAGSSQTTLANREFSRRIDGYERCEVGALGCPRAGTFTLVRPRLELVIAITGAGTYDLTVNGRTFSDRRIAWCAADGS